MRFRFFNIFSQVLTKIKYLPLLSPFVDVMKKPGLFFYKYGNPPFGVSRSESIHLSKVRLKVNG